MICLDCLGDGCKKCGERGKIKQNVPPIQLITDLNCSIFKAYKWLKNYNILPIKGGWLNQSAKFVNAVDFCESISNKMSILKESEKSDKAKEIENFKNMMNKKKHGR